MGRSARCLLRLDVGVCRLALQPRLELHRTASPLLSAQALPSRPSQRVLRPVLLVGVHFRGTAHWVSWSGRWMIVICLDPVAAVLTLDLHHS